MLARRRAHNSSLRSFFSIEHRSEARIRGVFVNGHIAALRRLKGDTAVAELEQRFGRSVRFGATEWVPLRDEVAILEHTLDIIDGYQRPRAERAREAGALHYRNFCDTTLGSALMRSMRNDAQGFTTMLHNAPSIARIVFEHTEFSCQTTKEGVVLTITNCNYPLEHFEGFFAAWLRAWGLHGTVEARATDGAYEYLISFGSVHSLKKNAR